LLLISVSFYGIGLLLSFIYGVLVYKTPPSIIYKITRIYSIIVIIIVSNVFFVIQKRSKKLYVLFYLAVIVGVLLLFINLIGLHYSSIIFHDLHNGNNLFFLK
jgi:hypothetical protein